jgi:hypothetical protein
MRGSLLALRASGLVAATALRSADLTINGFDDSRADPPVCGARPARPVDRARLPGADHMLCAARADGELAQCPLLAGVEEFMRDWLVRQAAVPAAAGGRSGGK